MDKNILLSIKDLEIKFRVRGRTLQAIRGISLDIFENESIAIVGESGSGKSVFTKTFAGMLDDNGIISNGDIIFNDEELSDTYVKKNFTYKKFFKSFIEKKIEKASKKQLSSKEYLELLELYDEKSQLIELPKEKRAEYKKIIADLVYNRTETYNLKLTYDTKLQKAEINDCNAKIKEYDFKIKEVEAARDTEIKARKEIFYKNKELVNQFAEKEAELKKRISELRKGELTEVQKETNALLCKEAYLSVGRYDFFSRFALIQKLIKSFEYSFEHGEDLNRSALKNAAFDKVAFRVKYLDEDNDRLHGRCIINLAKVKYAKDWQQIRGKKVATVFQDPMTSLNPIITIGQQISNVIIKHQHVSENEARVKAIEMMHKVGIPNPEQRYEDYPFQYSGGMRQRIVIAIALCCQPKILICDEPTTALDVTIQAQILKLIKDLQKEFNYTIVFITHDLGVVANIADRVAVLYAGQIIELGTVEDVFYEPAHPYTWALLSSLPQLAEKNSELFSIAGTPPSLYNKIIGDPFAPRNPYCLKIDTMKEAPMFKITETHYAKTWLLDPRSPKVEKPSIINNIHEKLLRAYNIKEEK